MPALPPSAPATDYDAFLQAHVHSQPHNVMRYHVQDETLWVKRGGTQHPAWRYKALGAAARALKLPVLSPVPNPGGRAAIATEVQRLQDLAARGLRVPQVLAHTADGFVMRHLGAPGQDTPSLGNEMERAAQAKQADTADTTTAERRAQRRKDATLALWRQGLQAIHHVHKAGSCLSQAFARNLVRCPDGTIGFIDFEDDPAAHLPLPLCHVRDALCYAHSTAWILEQADALAPAREHWRAWTQTLTPAAQQLLRETVARMGWAGKLPRNRRLGRDAQRIRMAFELLHSA